MSRYRTLHCHYCGLTVLSMTEEEITKLNGLSFQCEGCGHLNLLMDSKLNGRIENDPFINILSIP